MSAGIINAGNSGGGTILTEQYWKGKLAWVETQNEIARAYRERKTKPPEVPEPATPPPEPLPTAPYVEIDPPPAADPGTWVSVETTYSFFSVVSVSYSEASSGEAEVEAIPLTELWIDYRDASFDGIVGNSMLFDFGGVQYRESAGTLFTGSMISPDTAGEVTLSQATGTITEWTAGPRALTVRAALTSYGRWPLESVKWRTLGRPIRSESFQVTNGDVTATSDDEGDLAGAGSAITGTIGYDYGVYDVTFDPPQLPETVRYNAVALTYLPQNPAILGLDPVRLPLTGTVPIFRPADVLVIHNTQTTALPNPAVAGSTYALPRGLVAYIELRDAEGEKIPTDRYTVDLVAGEVTMANPLDLDGYTQPLQAEHRIEDMLFCLDAQLSGQLGIAPGGLTHTYPATTSYVSSAKLVGDLQAIATAPFDQQAWTGVWSDSVIGAGATAEYNDLVYPIEVTNAGTVKERWRIEFLTSNTFRLIGEQFGVLSNGEIGVDFSPVNPLTGEPFFTIRALGWGSGWIAGNQLRFNTEANAAPFWLLRCTLQGPEEEPNDSVRIQFRGDSQ